MQKFFRTVLILLTFAFTLVQAQISVNFPDLMPVPKEVQLSNGRFVITSDLIITIKGAANERIYPAATRFLRRLDARVGLFFPQDHITASDTSDTANVIIICDRSGKVELRED